MQRLIWSGALAAALGVTSADAMVQRMCMQPTAPMAYLHKPMRPYCAATRSCSESEVSAYRFEVEQYFRRLRQYAGDVDGFYQEAATYIQCMSQLD
jgi:hypothetical protein